MFSIIRSTTPEKTPAKIREKFRDLRLDSLRGIFLVIMMIDHLGGTLSGLTFEPFGYVTAATAFILLSGYMYAYTSPEETPTLEAVAAQSRKRAAKIYRYHLVLFALLLLPTLVTSVYRGYLGYLYLDNESALTSFMYGASLLHQPPFMHILPLYLIMSLLSPLILMGLHRGWDVLILAISVAVWMLGQIYDPLVWLTAATASGASPGQFNLFGWQLLWTSGLYIGFLHRVRKNTVFYLPRSCLYLAMLVTVGFFLMRHQIITHPKFLEFYAENSDFRLLRVINTLSQIIVFLYIIKKLPVDKGLPWFSFLGRYSLQVFTYHVFLVCLLAPISWRIAPKFGIAADVLYTLLMVASMTLPAWFYSAYERHQRENSGYATWPRKFVAVKELLKQLFGVHAKAH